MTVTGGRPDVDYLRLDVIGSSLGALEGTAPATPHSSRAVEPLRQVAVDLVPSPARGRGLLHEDVTPPNVLADDAGRTQLRGSGLTPRPLRARLAKRTAVPST